MVPTILPTQLPLGTWPRAVIHACIHSCHHCCFSTFVCSNDDRRDPLQQQMQPCHPIMTHQSSTRKVKVKSKRATERTGRTTPARTARMTFVCLLFLLATTTASSSSNGNGNGGSNPGAPVFYPQNSDNNNNNNDDNNDYNYRYDYNPQYGEGQNHDHDIGYDPYSPRRPPPPPPPPGSTSGMTFPYDTAADYQDPSLATMESQSMPMQEDHPEELYYRSTTPGTSSQQQRQRPPLTSSTLSPPPPPRIPIHYEFPMAMDDNGQTNVDADNVNVNAEAGVKVDTDTSAIIRTKTDNTSSSTIPKASPRNDLITRYMSTKSGKLQVYLSSTVVGASTGVILSKSFLPFGTVVWATVGASTCLGSSLFLRTPLGELTRAVALSLLLVAQRTQSIRKRYPTWRYIPSALFQYGGGGREMRSRDGRGPGYRRPPPPFPPTRNPWTYAPRRPSDAEFNMIYSILAMAFVGSTCGGNLPMIPTWMGSLLGACLFALGCTLTDSPRGDLCRTMGMRVVALVQELWDIQAQLKIVPKAAVVSSQIIDRLMILDRQHKVKDRFLQLVNTGYEQAMKTASRVQEQRLEAQGRNNSSTRTTMSNSNNRMERDRDRDTYRPPSTRQRGRRGGEESIRDDRAYPSRRSSRRDFEDQDDDYYNKKSPMDRNYPNDTLDMDSAVGAEDDYDNKRESTMATTRRRRPRDEDDNDYNDFRRDSYKDRSRNDNQDDDYEDNKRDKPKRGWFGR